MLICAGSELITGWVRTAMRSDPTLLDVGSLLTLFKRGLHGVFNRH